ncbi:MAG: hypothetical protein ACI4PS_03120 [Rhodocyclaceae bacterium]
MKKIALFNSVYNGGKTLLNYLTPIAKILQEQLDYEFDVFQFCNSTIEESEQILNHKVLPLQRNLAEPNPVLSINVEPLQTYDIVITNRASISRLFNENIFVIATNHGFAPMPLRNVLQNADALTFNVILCYGKSSLQQVKFCLQTLRNQYVYKQHKRIANRKTFLANTFPLKLDFTNFHDKLNNIFENKNQNLVEKYNTGNLVIGLLPTFPETIVQGISLFDNIDKLLTALLQNFPLAKIILRPYIFNPSISSEVFELLNIFSANVTNFKIDNSGQSSNDFYNQCDILISDGSTGGITYLLNKAMPPIYYIPKNVVNTNETVNNFVEIQRDKVFFAYNINTLIQQVNKCINLSKEQRKNYFTNHCENDLFLDVDNKELLQKIIDEKVNDFPFVDENGNAFNV